MEKSGYFSGAILDKCNSWNTFIVFVCKNNNKYFWKFKKKCSKSVEFFGTNIFGAFFSIYFLFVLSISLLQIAKKQIRVPFILNYAVNGYDKRITLEKIHISNCPQCGGKMRYYNRPVEWVNKYYSDGQTKREVAKRIPVFECKRNRDHWYEVDPAGDRVN